MVRTAAAEAIGRLQQTQAIEALTALTEHGDLRSRSIATIGLTHADLTRAAEAAAAILSQDPGEMEPSNLVASFIRRDKGATQLSAQLDREAIHPRVLEQVAAYHRRTGQLPRNLARLFSPALAVIIAPFLATPNVPGAGFVKYTLPARELRRLLHTARSANEPFYLEYSHLPDYTGGGEKGSGHATVPSRVRVALDGRGQWTCTVLRRIGWLGLGRVARAF